MPMLSKPLALQQQEFVAQFNFWLAEYLAESKKNNFYSLSLLKSQEYSLTSGGKRFRPFLTYLVYSLFSDKINHIKQICLALEMMHTYSLIHDDLPCMDNDDFRRGQPTNHKMFSEDIALLAGDGLLTDVFKLISFDPNIEAEQKVELIKLISDKSGSAGMVSGQAFDMQVHSEITFEELVRIHTLKTSNLIQAAALSGAIAAKATADELKAVSDFSFHLGMAFQIKDDLLDYSDNEQDYKSYLSVLGLEKTEHELNLHSEKALEALRFLQKYNILAIQELIQFNIKRTT